MLHLPFGSLGPIPTKFTVTLTSAADAGVGPGALRSGVVGPEPLNAKKQFFVSIVGLTSFSVLLSWVASTQKPPFWRHDPLVIPVLVGLAGLGDAGGLPVVGDRPGHEDRRRHRRAGDVDLDRPGFFAAPPPGASTACDRRDSERRPNPPGHLRMSPSLSSRAGVRPDARCYSRRVASPSAMRRAALLIGYLAVLLGLDHFASYPEQLGLGVVTWALLIVLAWQLPLFQRAMVLGVVCFATIGEVTGSLIWGVYRYRLHNLPLFVPPAHGLVYLTGIAIAAALAPHARAVVIAAAAAAATWGAARALRPAPPRRRRRGRDPAAPALPLALAQPRRLRERLPRRRRPRALRHGDRDMALGGGASGARHSRREPALGRRLGLRLVRRDGAAVRAALRLAAQNSVDASRAAPTCSRPSSVMTRPRGVRCSSPSWSRYGS